MSASMSSGESVSVLKARVKNLEEELTFRSLALDETKVQLAEAVRDRDHQVSVFSAKEAEHGSHEVLVETLRRVTADGSNQRITIRRVRWVFLRGRERRRLRRHHLAGDIQFGVSSACR